MTQKEESASLSDELYMAVCTATCPTSGATKWGPRYELEPGRTNPDGSREWYAMQLGHDLEPIARATVSRHIFRKEPLLCLAARGAWSLWGKKHPEPAMAAYSGLAIEVTYGNDLMAATAVMVDDGGSVYTGWSWNEGVSLALKTPDGPGLRNVEQWICAVFNKVAFGTVRPPRRRTERERPRCLPSCWSTGRLPATALERRNVCLIDYWGGPQLDWYFSHV